MADSTLKQALAHAPAKSRPQAAAPDEEYFVFKVDTLIFGVTSEHVREVTRMGPLTPLPRTPSFVLGVVGHRGQVFPLIDLLRFLGQGETRTSSRTRLFVIETQGFVVGFVADEVIGLRRLLVADKLPPPAATGGSSEFLDGLISTPDLGAMTLLNIARVVTSARHKVASR